MVAALAALAALAVPALAPPAAARELAPRYQISCQSRSEFVGRLRSLVHDPDRVEIGLAQLSIAVKPAGDASSDWTLSVARIGAANEPPRTLRDASCEAVAEAAALIAGVWIDEFEADSAAQIAAVASTQARAASRLPARKDSPWHTGPILFADGALRPSVGASAGGSFGWMFRRQGDVPFILGVGFSLWPQHSKVPRRHAHEAFETFVEQVTLLLRAGDVSVGPWAAVHLALAAWQEQEVQPPGIRFSLGLQLQWDLNGSRWGLFARAGASTMFFKTTEAVAALGLSFALL